MADVSITWSGIGGELRKAFARALACSGLVALGLLLLVAVRPAFSQSQGEQIYIVPFQYDGLDAQLFEPVYSLMSDLSRLKPEGQFCADYEAACQLDPQTDQRIRQKIPGTPSIAERPDLRRLSDLLFYPLVASHDKSLLNYAARQGYLRTYGQVARSACVPKQEMDAYMLFLGALAWRARGGGLYDKPNSKSTLYRLMFGDHAWRTMARVYGLGRSRADTVGQAMFEGLKEPWGEWIDMGRAKRPINNNRHTGNVASDYHNLSQRGLRQVAGVSQSLKSWGANAKPMNTAGLHMGSCYLMAWNAFREKPGIGTNLGGRLQPIVSDPLGWGEMCTGASLAFGLTRTLSANYSCGRQ